MFPSFNSSINTQMIDVRIINSTHVFKIKQVSYMQSLIRKINQVNNHNYDQRKKSFFIKFISISWDNQHDTDFIVSFHFFLISLNLENLIYSKKIP